MLSETSSPIHAGGRALEEIMRMVRPVFVFGSNLKGIHGKGAARYTREYHGAEMGIGEGRTGNAYALPTMRVPGVPLKLDDVAGRIRTFLSYAKEHRAEQFQVTAVGCGLAGFKPEQIAPLFEGYPSNCQMPPEFAHIRIRSEEEMEP